MPDISVSVIIACAGESSRMGGVNKQFSLIAGTPAFIRSMLCFKDIPEIKEIIISARAEDMKRIGELIEEYNFPVATVLAEGGNTRQESVLNAFKKARADTRLIAVHDGARPLADPARIRQCIKDASVFGGAALGVQVKDTLKAADGGLITDTIDRSRLYIIQTPQIFRREAYVRGINFALEHGLDFTDDCQLAEAVGVPVYITPSLYSNIKITSPEDLLIAEAIFNGGNKV